MFDPENHGATEPALDDALADDLAQLDTRGLLRKFRQPGERSVQGLPVMPESTLWHVFLELQSRADERAAPEFARALKALLRRRGMAGVELPTHDGDPDEHRRADDAFLGELWKAYKRCIRGARIGPAAQLLRDIEVQLGLDPAGA